MDKQQKQTLKKMISGYCDLKGLDKKLFVVECKQKFGEDDSSFARGVLSTVKADAQTLEIVDKILELDLWQNMEILPANEVNNHLSAYFADDVGDKELAAEIAKEVLGEAE